MFFVNQWRSKVMAEIIFIICLLCVYLAIGFTYELYTYLEDSKIGAITVTLFWPFVWVFLIIFYIISAFIGKSTKRKIYRKYVENM